MWILDRRKCDERLREQEGRPCVLYATVYERSRQLCRGPQAQRFPLRYGEKALLRKLPQPFRRPRFEAPSIPCFACSCCRACSCILDDLPLLTYTSGTATQYEERNMQCSRHQGEGPRAILSPPERNPTTLLEPPSVAEAPDELLTVPRRQPLDHAELRSD